MLDKNFCPRAICIRNTSVHNVYTQGDGPGCVGAMKQRCKRNMCHMEIILLIFIFIFYFLNNWCLRSLPITIEIDTAVISYLLQSTLIFWKDVCTKAIRSFLNCNLTTILVFSYKNKGFEISVHHRHPNNSYTWPNCQLILVNCYNIALAQLNANVF